MRYQIILFLLLSIWSLSLRMNLKMDKMEEILEEKEHKCPYHNKKEVEHE